MDQIKIGKFIAELRKGRGMTQEQMAKNWASAQNRSRAGKTAETCLMRRCLSRCASCSKSALPSFCAAKELSGRTLRKERSKASL